jgi:branched-chain amino acid transport system ATP-binding protein/nonpolar-amino-acid-transporting ATPase
MNPAYLLELKDVSHSFGGFRALDNVDLAVPRGAICGLMGPNGSGKTTLFNVATGYVRPQRGEVIFKEADVRALSVADRGTAGLVRTFQTPKVFDGMSVLENVMAGLSRLRPTGFVQDLLRTTFARRQLEEMRSRAEIVCRDFALDPLLHAPAARLTVGQRRMVELARAVASEPELLLLDEPSSGLSSEETFRLRESISALRARGVTVLLVSHDMGLMDVTETVSVLYFGRIIARGTMEEVRRDARVREVYLGTAKC